MAEVTSILIVGVGGQGIVLAGDVIGMAARLAGLDAKASEVHGMSQRGGSVVSEVRFGAQVFSPLIPPPGADFVLAFELLEGLRALSRLRPGGMAIVNRQRILPASVTYGTAEYPADAEATIRRRARGRCIVDALQLANDARQRARDQQYIDGRARRRLAPFRSIAGKKRSAALSNLDSSN